MIKKQR